MTHVVKINESSVEPFLDPLSVIQHGRSFRKGRPSYPDRVAGTDYWFLRNDVHAALKSPYTISFRKPYWLISIDDAKEAMLFKLAWGES